MEAKAGGLVRASLTQLDSLEEVVVDWNPERYSLSRASRLDGVGELGRGHDRLHAVSGGEERFSTELFLDASCGDSSGSGDSRDRPDLRRVVDKLQSWMEPDPASGMPPRVVFLWGGFRFRGVIEKLDQVWVRFDPDGTPLRGHVRLTIRR